MKQIRKRLTYANVMSTIAVFLVLGGATALAAGQLGKNTVGAKQLKKNAVTAAKVKKEAITAAKIKNGAINAAKLAAGAVGTAQLGKASVTGEKLAANAVGPTNIADNAVTATKLASNAVIGTKIAAGSVTASKLGPITVQTETVAVPAGANGSANVDCPPGQRAISGGGNWGAFIKGLSFLSSRPIKNSVDVGAMANGEVAGGWRSSGDNESATEATSIQVYVLCAQ